MKGLKDYKDKLIKQLRRDLLVVKEGLNSERRETQQMLQTYLKFSQGEASKEEMKEANEQFRSFLKTLGLGALAILPMAPVTIPLLIKLGRKFGIDILPKWFKEL